MISLLLSSSVEGDLTFFESIIAWVENATIHLYENPLFGVAALIIFGLVGGKLISLIKFPRVTGYILIGIIVGPSVLRVLSHEMVESFTIIRQVAIGFIGYTIGLELRFSKLKKTGKQVTIITVVQAFTTAILVTLAIYAYRTATGGDYIWTYALILGAIATATAPGPIVAVVKSYRTKGPVTDVLLPLVALDDAIGIMLFAVMLSLGTSFISGPVSIGHMLLDPFLEISMSLGFGALIGFIVTKIAKAYNRESDSFLMMVIIGFVFLGIAIGQAVHASAILLPMTIGVFLTNSIDERYEHRLTQTTDLFSAPILLAFFTIAGAELQLSLLAKIGLMGGIYLFVRVIGKVTGSYVSAKALKAPPTVVKYLGFTLIPQAGVAIDMALTTQLRFEEADLLAHAEVGAAIMTIVLAATVIYEVFGLVVVKSALGKAGEIDAAVGDWE
ncbi:potassium/proton antiporter [Candidatus Izimaplasma bacterium HR1]|uniref:cation:proton antiporter n=1 Tax=Candidatus Izimoplasma sp. HR1 TaxID=1541959 RepID=UPI0004F7E8DA|nr:potassium/proton antiporter [Candidatus Izimaplasma bacterium HR1]